MTRLSGTVSPQRSARRRVAAHLLWTSVPLASMTLSLFYFLVTTSLWFAPLYGALMLVSAAVPRAPFVWAVLPVVVLMFAEHLALGTHHFASFLLYRVRGGYLAAYLTAPAGTPQPGPPEMTPLRFFGTPGLWLGLIAGAAFFAACVWLRRRRPPL